MFRLFCRNSLIGIRNQHLKVQTLSPDGVGVGVGVVQNNPLFLLRFVSQIPETANSQSPIVDFLITKCGLLPKKAISVSKRHRVGLSSTENPNSVLGILENNGFTKTQIAKVISNSPLVLLLDPDDNLKPKIYYFNNLGFSGPNLAKLISANPELLKASLKDQIIPSIDFIKTLLPSDSDVLTVLKHNSFIIRRSNIEKFVGANIATLQNIGVPKSNISKLLMTYPTTFMANVERFICVVDEIKQMGFDPLSLMFTCAVWVMASMSKPSLEVKQKVFREFGFSEEETLLMFRREPICMKISEKKIRKGLDFFMNQLKWDSAYICKYPVVLKFSMEKRVIPRYSVLENLILEGSLPRSAIVGNIFTQSENKFLEKFVIKYKESVPQVVKTYKDGCF